MATHTHGCSLQSPPAQPAKDMCMTPIPTTIDIHRTPVSSDAHFTQQIWRLCHIPSRSCSPKGEPLGMCGACESTSPMMMAPMGVRDAGFSTKGHLGTGRGGRRPCRARATWGKYRGLGAHVSHKIIRHAYESTSAHDTGVAAAQSCVVTEIAKPLCT